MGISETRARPNTGHAAVGRPRIGHSPDVVTRDRLVQPPAEGAAATYESLDFKATYGWLLDLASERARASFSISAPAFGSRCHRFREHGTESSRRNPVTMPMSNLPPCAVQPDGSWRPPTSVRFATGHATVSKRGAHDQNCGGFGQPDHTNAMNGEKPEWSGCSQDERSAAHDRR